MNVDTHQAQHWYEVQLARMEESGPMRAVSLLTSRDSER